MYIHMYIYIYVFVYVYIYSQRKYKCCNSLFKCYVCQYLCLLFYSPICIYIKMCIDKYIYMHISYKYSVNS